MDNSESVLIPVDYNKLVLKKRYMIKTNGLVFTGTFYYMFGANELTNMLGFGQPVFIDFKPTIENKSMLICTSLDEFYELKVKIE